MSDIEKILGLDLGTNSIGFSLRALKPDPKVNLDIEETEDESLVEEAVNAVFDAYGVVVFPMPINMEKGNEVGSLASVRTGYRASRRRYFRKFVRRIELLEKLVEYKMVPLTEQELHDYKKNRIYPTKNQAFVSWLKLDFNGDGKPDFLSPYEVSEETKGLLGENWEVFLSSPYQLRALAIECPDLITDEMLGRIAYHFIQRRGYSSNRKDRAVIQKDEDDEASENIEALASEDFTPEKVGKSKKSTKSKKGKDEDSEDADAKAKAETKKVLDAIKGYEETLNSKNLTAGQEIAQKLIEVLDKDGAPQRARNRLGTTNKYGRPLFQKEWQSIIRAKGYDPEVGKWAELERIIFRNRPLKSQKRNIGRCPLEKNKFRMPISHPVYEFSVLWQVVNNVKYDILPVSKKSYTEDEFKKLKAKTELTLEQKHRLVQALIQKTTVDSEKLAGKVAKVLELKEDRVITNYDDAGIGLGGTPFIATCKKQLGDELFENLYQAAIERYVLEQGLSTEDDHKVLKRKEIDLFLLWQWMFEAESKEDEDRLIIRLENQLGLTPEKVLAIHRSVIDGYSRFSLTATMNILRFMEKGFRYDKAALMAKMPKLFGYSNWNGHEEFLIKELLTCFDENVKRNRAVEIANDWLSTYNRNINHEDPTLRPDRVEPSELDFEVKTALRASLDLRFKNLSEQEKEQTINYAEALVESKLRVGTRRQPYENGAPQPQQSIYTFGLYRRLSPFDVAVEFVNNNTNNHSESFIRNQLYNHSELETTFKKTRNQQGNELPSPITPSVKNPVAIRALNQLRRLINYLIREGKIDPASTAIQLEMSRDLNSANMRKAIALYQAIQEKERKAANDEIQKYYDEHEPGKTASDRDILKYRLWSEQKEKCFYSGKQIPLSELLSGEEFDIEHIVPQSRYPTSEMENLCISESNFNRNIKKATFVADLSEFPEIEKRIKFYKEKVTGLASKLKKLKNIKASTKEAKDEKIVKRHLVKMEFDYFDSKYKNLTTKEADFDGGFRKRQAHDTSIINKYAIKFLNDKFKVVKGSKGQVTAIARKAWGLQEVDEKKDRSFHYHHAKDAMVQTLLYQHGGEAGPYRLIAELSRGEGLLFDRYKGVLENAVERGNEVNFPIISILRKAEFMPLGLKPSSLKRLIDLAIDRVLVYHAPIGSPLKQTKKFLRDRTGKKLKNAETGEWLYQKGMGIRARLHMDTWYGSIKVRNEEGKLVDKFRKKELVKVTGSGDNKKGLTADRAKNIVDPKLREVALGLLKTDKNYFEKHEFFEIPPSEKTLKKNPYAIGRRVYKVNLFENTVSNPLKIKKHINPLGVTNELSAARLERKQHLYAEKGTNLMMALVENKTGKKLQKDMIPLAADQFKSSFNPAELIKPFMKEGFKLKHIFNIGDIVLFYENHPEEIDFNNKTDLRKRLYRISGITGDDRVREPRRQTPQLTFLGLDWAAGDGEVLPYYQKLFGAKEIDKTWKTGRSKYLKSESPIKLNVSQKGLNIIPVDGKALALHQDGRIEKLDGFKDWVPDHK